MKGGMSEAVSRLQDATPWSVSGLSGLNFRLRVRIIGGAVTVM